jgi:hypothetical protein
MATPPVALLRPPRRRPGSHYLSLGMQFGLTAKVQLLVNSCRKSDHDRVASPQISDNSFAHFFEASITGKTLVQQAQMPSVLRKLQKARSTCF